jgi:hypothetical protein
MTAKTIEPGFGRRKPGVTRAPIPGCTKSVYQNGRIIVVQLDYIMKKTNIHVNLKIDAAQEFLIRHLVTQTHQTRSDVMREALSIGLKQLARKLPQ